MKGRESTLWRLSVLYVTFNWNWVWTCKLVLTRTVLLFSLHSNLFIRNKGKKTISPWKTKYSVDRLTNEELKGLHGGVWLSLTGWLSSSMKPLMKPVSHMWRLSICEFDQMMIPAFLRVVYHLCPLFWYFPTIQQSCFINVAWILKPTSVLFLHPIDSFTLNCMFFFLYSTSFE